MKAELIDHMGSDLTVVNAARVSFDKESEWESWAYNSDTIEDGIDSLGYGVLKTSDEKLIHYLAAHNHWTPFAHAVITLRETVPIFVARQRFKHVVGFVYNEVSRRYVDDTPEFYYPEIWRKRAENKKQGSSDEEATFLITRVNSQDVDPVGNYKDTIAYQYDLFIETSEDFYNGLIKSDVAPEQARMVLPQSMYTSYYVTGSLAAWARAYKLRIDPHAQKEIQDLAVQWDEIIRPLYPTSWGALVDAKT